MKFNVTLAKDLYEKDILIGSAFIGIIVGAGFASGQEILQYFTSFGTLGILRELFLPCYSLT